MKWFKTKKDKRIEELKREIERKNKAIKERDRAMMLNGVTTSQRLRPQMLKFATQISVLENMDAESAIERAKKQLTNGVAEHILPYITWTIKDCGNLFDGHIYELYCSICIARGDDVVC